MTSVCAFNNRPTVVSAPGRISTERGLTLIEVTLMLGVSIVMIGALIPSLTSTKQHAEVVRALVSMAAISLQMNRALTDMGNVRFTNNGSNLVANQVNLLVSDGDTPRELAGVGSALWQAAVSNAVGSRTDFLERHLVTNNPRGLVANDYNLPGWKGAYLTAPIDPDPWGNRYMVNSASLGTVTSTYVFSAGPNEIIESAFVGAPAIVPGGDDILVFVR